MFTASALSACLRRRDNLPRVPDSSRLPGTSPQVVQGRQRAERRHSNKATAGGDGNLAQQAHTSNQFCPIYEHSIYNPNPHWVHATALSPPAPSISGQNRTKLLLRHHSGRHAKRRPDVAIPAIQSVRLTYAVHEQREGERNAPVRVIHLDVLAEQFLLARLVGQVAADVVAVLFGLEERDQVDAGPHLFAGEFARRGVLLAWWLGG